MSPETLPNSPVLNVNTTAAPMMINNDTLATPIVVDSAVVGAATLSSTFTPLTSSFPNPSTQDTPSMTLPEAIDFLHSGDNVITLAPTPSDDDDPPRPPIITIDSALPKITIETVRTSTAAATTTPGGRT
ncbi:hypothetical protein F5Y12DRAFT_32972 [Xylaria sp. FL1777]|nr:hypothetical protein F5Y12DRAFT_32972 [Xylaria sp. FL1777]